MIYLAIKHLLTRKKQSIITLLGIMIGTTAFIVMSCFFIGIRNQLTDSLVSGDAHIKIYAFEEDVTPDKIKSSLLEQFNGVKWIRKPGGRRISASIENPALWDEVFKQSTDFVAATPVYSTTVLVRDGQKSWTLGLTGIIPTAQIQITNIENKMTIGSLLDLDKGVNNIIIGEEFAKALGKEVGDTVSVTSKTGKNYPLKIIALFNTNNRRADMGAGFINLNDARKIGEAPGATSQINVKVKDFQKAAEIANNWSKLSQDKVESWDQAHGGLISMFESQDMTRYMATGIIMLVAAFGIYNILNMIVNQKRKDIAILRSMGYEATDIVNLFLFQGVALGFSGGAIGMLLGYIICQMIGTVEFGPRGAHGNGFTLDFSFKIYFTAFMISNIAAILASIFPSRSAAKLTPIEIIRSGAD